MSFIEYVVIVSAVCLFFKRLFRLVKNTTLKSWLCFTRTQKKKKPRMLACTNAAKLANTNKKQTSHNIALRVSCSGLRCKEYAMNQLPRRRMQILKQLPPECNPASVC